ncbi:hypothetical protein Ctaglu_27680 [Clostridium tagluense]|uniref:Uncharacterized protein n=1 Tax=Clostridium tagluense TaxID=360422 RepID=A0A401UNN5_9CLOT|nr:hypothetical protein Ctaglu_27680 [Clostridium tagluense]
MGLINSKSYISYDKCRGFDSRLGLGLCHVTLIFYCELTIFLLDYANKSIYCAECIRTSLSNSQFILFAGA